MQRDKQSVLNCEFFICKPSKPALLAALLERLDVRLVDLGDGFISALERLVVQLTFLDQAESEELHEDNDWKYLNATCLSFVQLPTVLEMASSSSKSCKF